MRGPHVSRRGADVFVLSGPRRANHHGSRRDADRRARGHAGRARAGRAAAQVHLHRPELPQSGRSHAVARAPPRAGADRLRARAARARGQPVRPASVRGHPSASAALARRGVHRLREHVLQDSLARRAAGLDVRARARIGQDDRGQAGLGPVLVLDLPVLRLGVLRVDPPALVDGVRSLADRDLPPPAGRDARRTGRAPPAGGGMDPSGGRAVHLGHAARLHRHHRPPRPGARGARGVRARPRRVCRRARRVVDAAELLGRGRGLTGVAPRTSARRATDPAEPAEPARAEEPAKVLPLRRKTG
jgi:hypothetical protein